MTPTVSLKEVDKRVRIQCLGEEEEEEEARVLHCGPCAEFADPFAQATGTRCACSVVRGIAAMERLAKSVLLRGAVLWCFVFFY